ncbi:MAG: hypothetical protein ABI920_14775 [Casimicrobiaceae bacterium]
MNPEMADRVRDAVTPPAAAGASDDAIAFIDAESAGQWLKTLPLTNVNELGAALLKALRAMTAIDYPPRERARIAELIRDQVAYLHTELARRYAGKPQPAGDRELDAAEQAIALWNALWEQYSGCLKPLLDGDAELEGVKAKVLQRGLYVGKQLVLVYGLARRSPPPQLWQEIHAYYRIAELLGCTGSAVSDELMPGAVGLSCYSTYSHALLLALADPCAMSVKQIELTDRWLQMWARKIFPYPQPRDTEGPLLLVELDAHSGAALVSAAPTVVAESMRFGHPHKLLTSVRGRLKRLQSGADPAELQLGRDCGIEQSTLLLSHLDAKWNQLPRSTTGLPASTVSLCGGGLPAAFFRVSGRTFERSDPLGRSSTYAAGSRGLQLQSLGAVANYDNGREDAERKWTLEEWQGTYDHREAALVRTSDVVHRWCLDQLVYLRDAERNRVGYVTRVAQGEGGELQVSLRLFSGKPTAVAASPVTTAMGEDPPVPCLLLGEMPDDKPSLILPPRTFHPGRVFRSIDGGPERQYRLVRLLQRGADFERASFEIAE